MLEGNGNAIIAKVVAKVKPKPAKIIVIHDPLPGIRALLGPLMDGTVKNTANWHYKEVRPLPYPSEETALHGVVVADCSFGCFILNNLAGGASQSGKFDGYGNSSSMYDLARKQGRIITKAELQAGDDIVLGSGGRLHAMKVRSTLGGDPLCWSNGGESGPKFVPLSAEVAYHAALFADGGVVTYLRLAAA